MSDPEEFRVVVVGAGLAGVAAAIKLERAGIDDVVVLEKAERVGGTWRDNTYPGCGCDIPSNVYSFTFNPNPRWTSTFALQPDILDYIEDTAEKFGVYRKIGSVRK
ncbi:cation diffusion facilitator CzcD-associated flavoprotein CzcO [Hoyosella altamirensis]|uniref:Cation diffusion facilitator CzcD-associated flavoprotein CzcO n=1 Tax=Hoyosella altamirensis TaxID=616997 RepID=A0A839RJI6_9ACTN|nr:cation diffusion facilitator CzcD-associated flavoprotein CzcO [Hoyosella altamirensis]